MKAEVCLRLRLVCPIVSLPLPLSLSLSHSRLYLSIFFGLCGIFRSFTIALFYGYFVSLPTDWFKHFRFDATVLWDRRVPEGTDAPRIGVNDRFYEASLGLLAQLPSRNDRRWSWSSSSSRKLPQVENSRNFAPGTSRDFLVHFSSKNYVLGISLWHICLLIYSSGKCQ